MGTFIGKVKKVGCFPIPAEKQTEYKGKISTHRLALQVEGDLKKGVPDDTWIGMGNTDKDSFIVKDKDDNWKVLGAGSEVVISYEESTHNGKKFYNSGKSKLTIDVLVEGEKFNVGKKKESSNSNDNAPQAKPKFNQVGMQTGHSLNCAIDFMCAHNEKFSKERLVELAKWFHDSSEWLKAEHKKNNPELNDFDVAASSGMAIKAAASITKSEDDVIKVAQEILDSSKYVTAHIKGEKIELPKAEKKEEPKKETKKSVEKIEDMDDIPF